MKGILKGIIIVSLAIPTSLIVIGTASKIAKNHSNKNNK